MGKFDYSKMQELLQNMSVDLPTHKISYSMYPINSKSVYDEGGSKLVTVKANVEVLVKSSGERIVFTVDLLKLPHFGETGFIIKGKNRQVIDLYTKSHGWYVLRSTGDVKQPHLKLESEYGKNFIIYQKDYQLFITSSNKVDDGTQVPLAVFLKAFTGSSYQELANKLGTDNVYVLHSFQQQEMLKSDCVDKVITSFFEDFRHGRKNHEMKTLSAEDRFSLARQRLFSPRSMILGETTGVRMKRALNFKERCRNLFLDEDLEINGKTYKRGMVLDARTLEEIDYSPINTLKVYNTDRKRFTVKKNSIFNFRALGYTLEQDVTVAGRTYEKGTVLTVDILRALDKSRERSILVSNGNVTINCSRKLYTGVLDVQDIMSMVQVFLDTLSGLESYDDIYDLTNQNLVTIEISALSMIKDTCKVLNYYIDQYVNSHDEEADLATRILELTGFDTNALLNRITSVESVESQQSELNNTIQKLSKEHKVTKQVARSSDDMTSVRASQFGFLDPIESPESNKIGTVHTKTWLSSTDDSGFLVSPYIRVQNGVVVSEEPVYLTAADREDQYIASWDETFHTINENGEKVLKEKVLTISGDTMLEVPVSLINYKEYSPYQSMSPARMQIPFQEHSNPKRLLMGGNHQKQTVPLIKNERPFVSSGGDSLLDGGYFTAQMILEDYYDSNSALLEEYDRAEFVSKVIELTTTDFRGNTRDLYFKVEGVPGHTPVLNIPFGQKASSGAMFSYKINTTKGVRYSGRDIVAYSSDLDIKEYDIMMHANFGHQKIDTHVFDKAIGLSRNLVVGYKTFEGSSIDDAITINADLVYDDTMTTIDLHQFTYTLREPSIDEGKRTKEYEEFGFVSRTPNQAYMGGDGLPKLGTVLKPGDVVLGVRGVKQVYSKNGSDTDITTFDKSKRLEGTAEGKVIAAYIENDEAVVMLAALKPLEEGDKLAGRYGNKGVVARIVPRELMPFDPVTGQVLDVILSPEGVPSRSNISQLLEGLLGMVMRKLGKICVVTPYIGNTLEFVRGIAEEHGVRPMMLRDGRTGKYFERPINVVCSYILKLEHMVSHKIRGIGLSNKVDPVFNQPTKGAGLAGGQAFGEMETWCMMAVGAHRILQDLQSVQSDDLRSIEHLEAAIAENAEEINIEGNNNNDAVFQVIMRSLCVEPVVDEDGSVVFKPLTDNMIRGMSSRPIDLNDKESLRSSQIFGVTSNPRIKFDNRTTWSWMPLHAEIVHPLWILKGQIHKFLLVGKPDKNTDKIEVNVAQMGMLKELIACKYYLEEEYVKDRKVFVFYRGNVEGKLTGMPALVHMLRTANLQDIKSFYQSKLNNSRTDTNALKWTKLLRSVEDFESAGLKLSDLVISSYPIMPLSFRPASMFKNRFQDFDYYYRRMIDEVVKYRALGKTDPHGIYQIYLRIVEFCGFTYGSELKVNKGYTSLLKYFSKREGQDKKHGHIRESLLKKRVLFSGRTVIIPSRQTKRLPTQIGVPFLMVLDIWRPQLVSKLNHELSHFGFDKRAWEQLLGVMGSNMEAFRKMLETEAMKAGEDSPLSKMSATEVYDQIYGIIQTYVEGYKDERTGEWIVKPRVVLCGRQPSLHKFNIRAYFPVITDRKCIEIHPLVAKGYNADYDGDQMWLIGLINDAACEEAIEKLSPKQGVINPKDNSVVLDHSQDMKLGVYLATMLHNNVDHISKDPRYDMKNLRFYSDLGQLSTDVDLDFLSIHDLVCYTHKGRKYLATAGRILFNGLLPDGLGFTDEPFKNILDLPGIDPNQYYNLRFDGLIAGGGGSRKTPVYRALSEVTSWSYNNLDPDENLKVFQAISEFGFKYCDELGISLYLDDFTEDPTMQPKIEKANAYADVVNRRYFQGLISDETRKQLLIEIYNGCKDSISETFMASFDRNNNIFIMFDSGARGSEGQIMQACGIIGVLQKSKNETLEVPVLSNYSKGNSSFDTLLLSFSTRTGVASTQNETATSGELTRVAVYMSSGLKIVEHDCGGEFEEYKLAYGKFTDKVLGPAGNNVGVKGLIGKFLSESDEYANKLLVNFLGVNSEINEKCVRILIKNKVKRVICTDGEYRLFYELDSLWKSLLLRREALNLPFMFEDKFISPETIKHIESMNLETIKIRLMLSCKSIGGVCARCYGWRYDVNELPAVGDLVGIESAQSIGEPAAQLVLSLFHQGGVAGASVSGGVDVLKSLLKSGNPSRVMGAILPPASGYIYYNSGDRNVQLVCDDGNELMFPVSNELIVESGEYVNFDTPLTTGFIIPLGLDRAMTLEKFRFKQMALLELYFRTFELSKIKVNARHFEVFARLQANLVTVLNSSNEKFIPGHTYEIIDILQNSKEGEVDYVFDIKGSKDVITHFSGLATELAREDLATSLGQFVVEQRRSPGTSPIGKLFYGQDVTDSVQKILTLPQTMSSVEEIPTESPSHLRELEGILTSELIKVSESATISFDDDLDGLFDFDSPEPTIIEIDSYNEVKETEVDEPVKKPESTTKEMKLF